VTAYDVFNGDADGLCALRQLRLDDPRKTELVTGVKRDIALLSRVQARHGDRLVVLDVSLHENRAALQRALQAGASCLYFDHHYAGDIPVHPLLEARIRYAPDTCTSLLVDEYLGGRWRKWAVTAAFGDNLPGPAAQAAAALGLAPGQVETLEQVGCLLNYNAYGGSVEELHYAPADLYHILERYSDPLEFARLDPAFDRLARGWRGDMARAAAAPAMVDTASHVLVVLPDAPWARRVSGPWANELASRSATRAVAVAVATSRGYTVSVRAPAARPHGADVLARHFASGGGRPGAAGINTLPEADLERFAALFQRSFGPAG
jgi:hypothetical protein